MTEAKNKNFGAWIKAHGNDLAAYGGLVLCLIIFTIFPPLRGESIWTAAKLSTLMSDVIVTAIMSVGAIFVYSLGNMDISVGSQIRLYATMIIILANATGSLAPGIILSFAIALGIAVVNASAGQLLKMHPIVPSLIFMMVLNGICSIMYTKLGSRNIVLKGVEHGIFKNPVFMAAILIIEIVIVAYFFNKTKIGKNAKAIGANEVVAQQSGINLLKYKIICYIFMGIFCAVAAVFQMGYTGSASEATGTGYEMNVMIALILGGMPLSGGMKSKVRCAVVGAFTFSILDVGLPLIGVEPKVTFIIKAIIFIAVVLITCRKKNGVLPR